MSVRLLRGAFLALFLVFLSSSAAAQSPFYYYADGKRFSLEVVADVIAVQFVRPEAIAQAQTRFGELADAAPAYSPAASAGDNFVLLSTVGVSQGGAVQLAQSVEIARDLSVVWSNPVFRLGDFTLIVTDEFIAGFPVGTPRALVDAYNARNGVQLVSVISPDVYLLRVTPSSGVDALMMANRYEEEDVALYGEPNFYSLFDRRGEPQPEPITQVSEPFNTPTDPLFGLQWYLNNTGQFSGALAGVDIRAVQAWNSTQGTPGTIIAVLDDGVQITHPDLAAKIIAPFDAVTGDLDPSPYDTAITRARDGHGTAVAGIIGAASDNGVGIAGTCRQCRIMPIRIFRSVETSPNVIQLIGSPVITTNAINHAVNNGASVLSNSWGQSPSTTVTNAFRSAVTNGRGGLGAFVAVAAGNSYQQLIPYPASLSSALPGFIAVGASNWCGQPKTPTFNACNNNEGWGNNWGSEVGISAPGHSLATTDLTGADGYITNGDYVYFNGTSGATPVVAGVAGLLLSQNATWSADQVRERLMASAVDTHTSGYDVASGWGIVQANAALLGSPLAPLLANDRISGAASVTSLNYASTQTLLGAFVTRDEPQLCALTTNTVWFRYLPPYNQAITATTVGSNFDTVLAVYSGTPDSLTSVACNDDASGSATSSVLFSAEAGTTYYLVAGSFAGSASDPAGPLSNAASLTLNITTTTAPPSVTINGAIQLAGRPAPPNAVWSLPLTLEVMLAGGSVTQIRTTVTTDNSGAFSFATDQLVPGIYDIRIKNARSLATRVTATLALGINNVTFSLLREGDANNDNQVTLTDFSILAAGFNRREGEPGYDARADFNGDATITLQDFSLLAANFNVRGVDPFPAGTGGGS